METKEKLAVRLLLSAFLRWLRANERRTPRTDREIIETIEAFLEWWKSADRSSP